MTARDAIEVIKSECYVVNALNFDRTKIINTALDMAVKALEQEPCDEAVSRAAVLDEILKFSVTDGRSVSVTGLWTEVNDLPSVIPQPKMGRWIEVTNGRGGHECDLCHKYAPSYKSCDEYLSQFCPNCGAKMSNAESDL